MSAGRIRTVGVVGAGQMGRGIAQVSAAAGLSVFLADASADLAKKGRDTIAAGLAKLVEKGKVTSADADALVGRVTPAGSLGALASADLVVEAVTENFDAKAAIFRELDAVLPAASVLASNTSSISITKLASVTKRADRFIGMHFMNPVPVMKLVELVRGLATSPETFAEIRALAEQMGKTVITSEDRPGFIVNRVLIPFLNEACFALEGHLGTPEDIDTGAKLGLNHPMGPLELADLIGLDTVLFIAEVLHTEFGDSKYRPAPLLKNYVAAGWLGRKTGRGFYAYDAKGQKVAAGAK